MNKGQLTANKPLNVLLILENTDCKITSNIKEIIRETLISYQGEGNYNYDLHVLHLFNLDDIDDIYKGLNDLATKIISEYDLVISYGYGCLDVIAVQNFCAIPFICINPVYDFNSISNIHLKRNCKFIIENYLKPGISDINNVPNDCLLISSFGTTDIVPSIQPYFTNKVKQIISIKKRKQEQLFYDALMDMIDKIRIKSFDIYK